MRKIDKIIIHCTATREGQHWTVEQIRKMHVEQNGWRDIGYHYLIYLDGSIHEGRPTESVGAHTVGQNAHSIGVCYVGGVASDGKAPKDTRTPEQKAALVRLIHDLKMVYPNATVHGHREFAAKACPSFDVQKWLKEEYATATRLTKGEGNSVKAKTLAVLTLLLCMAMTGCKTTTRIEREYVHDTITRVNTIVDSVDRWHTHYEFMDGETVHCHDTFYISRTLRERDTVRDVVHDVQVKEVEKVKTVEKRVLVWWPCWAVMALASAVGICIWIKKKGYLW